MTYSIKRTGNLIEVHFKGSEEEEGAIAQLRADIIRLSEGKPRDILVDISKTRGTEAMPEDLNMFFEGLLFRRYAIYGGPPRSVIRTKTLLDSLPSEHPNLKFFRTEEDARTWLKEKDSKQP